MATSRKSRGRILVVEDDPAILQGLLDIFAFNGFQADGVEDGGVGLRDALGGAYDLLLLDVMLPTTDGFAICEQVRRARPTQPVIMLTAKGAESDIVAGFRAGADDYVCKPFSIRELMVRVEALLRRAGKTLGEERLELGGVVFDGRALTASCGDRSVELTRREMDIVAYLQRHRDRIVSKRELLKEVWNYADPEIETRTVDIHVLKLRKKIAPLTSDSLRIATVRGEGYRLEGCA